MPHNVTGEAASTPATGLTTAERINVLFEEYKALYGLAQFRLTSLERRATLAWAALGAFLTGFGAMASDAQRAFLVGVPLALFWLLRTTINHARSFEDTLRRLDEIECLVNRLAGDELLAFQSRHPSRGGAIGGRTGSETLLTVLMTGLAMLVACGYLFHRHADAASEALIGYVGYLAMISVSLVLQVRGLRSYRYRKARKTLRPRATASWSTRLKRRRTR